MLLCRTLSILIIYSTERLSFTYVFMFLSYYRQLSTDLKMKNYDIKTRFVSHQRPKDWANKTCINFIIFYFNIRGKLSVIRFLVWLRNSSNPVLIHRTFISVSLFCFADRQTGILLLRMTQVHSHAHTHTHSHAWSGNLIMHNINIHHEWKGLSINQKIILS